MSLTGKPATAYDHFNRRVQDMVSERSSWDAHFKDLINNFNPRKGKFYESDTNKGNRRNTLNNNTPLFARRTLRSGLMTGITSPARPWFRLQTPDPDMNEFGPVREWLDEVEKTMYRVFSTSNLYKALPNLYDELGVIGTGAMLDEDDFENISHFTPFTVGEYVLDQNGRLKIDTFGREYQMTVYQLVEEFGLDNCSAHVQRLWDLGGYSSWVSLRHIIEPVSVREFDGPQFRLDPQFKWRSVTYEVGEDELRKNVLRVKGYREFPIYGPRWDARAGDIYGYSAGMDALGDARALQVQEREKGKAVAKMVSPPTTAPTSLKNTNLSLLPGANNFTDDPNNVFRPIYQVTPQVQHLMMDIQATEERINRAFYVDLFLMISQQDDVRTATEIAARQEEKLLQLGPVLESLHDELLNPLIDRTFSKLMRLSEKGWDGDGPMLLPEPPGDIQGEDLKIDYISILAQAQRMVSTGAMERWVGFTGQLAGIKPAALDKIDEDAVVEIMAEDLGVPAKAIRSQEDLDQMRAAQAQQQEAQQNAMVTQGMVDAAQGLASIDTTGGNALTDIVGLGGAGGQG